MRVQTDDKNCGFFIPLFARKLAYGLDWSTVTQETTNKLRATAIVHKCTYGIQGWRWCGGTGALTGVLIGRRASMPGPYPAHSEQRASREAAGCAKRRAQHHARDR